MSIINYVRQIYNTYTSCCLLKKNEFLCERAEKNKRLNLWKLLLLYAFLGKVSVLVSFVSFFFQMQRNVK